MILLLSVFDLFQQAARIGGTINHRKLKNHIVIDIDKGFLYSIKSSHGLQFIQQGRGFFSGNHMVRCPYRGFHNPSGIPENHTCAGAFSHQVVVILVRQPREVDSLFPRPFGQLSCSDAVIHIPHPFYSQISPCGIHLFPADFEFLSCAWSERHIYDTFGINPHFLCKISLYGRPLHPDRALGGRYIISHFRIIGLHVFHPGRTAAGKLRKRRGSFGQPFHQLAGFLHNRHICRKIGIQNVISTQLSQQRHHLTLDKASVRHPEFLSQRRTDGGGSTENNNAVRIGRGFPDAFILISFRNASGRTDIGTLSAMDTDSIITRKAQVIASRYPDAFRTYLFTLAAFDALGLIPAYRRIIRFYGNPDVRKIMLAHPVSFLL